MIRQTIEVMIKVGLLLTRGVVPADSSSPKQGSGSMTL